MVDTEEKLSAEISRLKLELEETKSKLIEKEALFDNITEQTLAGYWIWNIKENSMFISPHLKAMLGYEDHEWANEPETINQLMHPSDLPDTYALLGKHVESNGQVPFEIEVRYKHKNEDILWVICTGNIVQRDSDGKPLIMIGCHIDNTALKKAEGFEKYAKELERKNVELEQFAYVASHDLQEPLNTIKGFANLAMDEVGDNSVLADYLGHIDQGSIRMTNLIKGILDYSLIGSETVMDRVDISKVIDQVLSDLNSQIKESEATITIDKLPIVMGYELELSILFQNLISNAIKFRSSDTPKIEIGVEKRQDDWLFSVVDNGIGVEPEYSKKIFKLYQRLHPKSAYEGNGLGLAQCAKIIKELHSGDIWHEHGASHGSIFRFTIPITV